MSFHSSTAHLFLVLNNIPLSEWTSLFIHSPTEGHLGCLQVLETLNKGLFFSPAESWLLPAHQRARGPCQQKFSAWVEVKWAEAMTPSRQALLRLHSAPRVNDEKTPKGPLLWVCLYPNKPEYFILLKFHLCISHSIIDLESDWGNAAGGEDGGRSRSETRLQRQTWMPGDETRKDGGVSPTLKPRSALITSLQKK